MKTKTFTFKKSTYTEPDNLREQLKLNLTAMGVG